MNRCLCIHAHFYQPPRENPWLEEVELQDSAHPYHDWNERIAAECYQPNAAARILDPDRRIADIVDNYSRISFNFGPTLLSWMERHQPALHQAVVDADAASRERFGGHGSALAQVYNHLIMPLANSRDKRTQVLWGLQDFEHRFGRLPEGMWLAETAVDLETLDLLAEHGIAFTILAPRQAHRVRSLDGGEWCDVSGDRVDPRQPYLCTLPSGRTIVLFFYDGPISKDVAFSGLLNDGAAFADRLVGAFGEQAEPQLVHIATDGETYGHHHHHGEMALAYCLQHVEAQNLARLTVYGEHLERHPPTQEVEIYENSSWSCVHGVERWRADCGCNSGGRADWNQAWRAPLRAALDHIRDILGPLYEREAAALLTDPWKARDDYIRVLLDRDEENVRRFLAEHAGRDLDPAESSKALRLLEMQRHAMLMYTSCGWFFDEISGPEAVQVLQYAARALQLAAPCGATALEAEFLEQLKTTPSNVLSNGAEVYERYVRPAALDLLRVGAHYAMASLFEAFEETAEIFSYGVRSLGRTYEEIGRQRLALGNAVLHSNITWEETHLAYAVLHLGDHNLSGGVREYQGADEFRTMQGEITEAFLRSDIPEVIRLQEKHFGESSYSLWHLFRDEQRAVLDQIGYGTLDDVEETLSRIYLDNYALMNFLHNLGIPLPQPLRAAASITVSNELKSQFAKAEPDPERLSSLVGEAQGWKLKVDREALFLLVDAWVEARLQEWKERPEDASKLATLVRVLELLAREKMQPDLWRAQNLYFRVGRDRLPAAPGEGDSGDEWQEPFRRLGELLGVRVPA